MNNSVQKINGKYEYT